jgi:phosphatidylinositol dimannoside acyltransferase
MARRRNGAGVKRLRGNLAQVTGSTDEAALDRLTRDAMRSYARYWLETFRLPAMDHAAVARRVNATGVAGLDAAHAAGRGVVIALPHMGNWDIAGVWLTDHGMPFTTVVERLRPEALYERFVAYRESIGMEVIPVEGGPTPAAEVLKARLRAGGTVCLVADRDLSGKGITVDFFGARTAMPAGPALLAATTGAALVPTAAWYDGDDWGLRLHPPLAVDTAPRLRDRVSNTTQQLADIFAGDIAAHAVDWHMLQKMW